MTAHGFVTHAARNRRLALLFSAIYLIAFLIIGLLMLAIFDVIFGNARHSMFVEPFRYIYRYAPFVLLLAAYTIVWNIFALKRELIEVLSIKLVTANHESRFIRIAEEQCISQGVRRPEFGIIEAKARNSVAIGVFGGRQLIAVTRGLLDDLDDDEIAAVLAHEIAHFRLRDTMLIAVNYALMRTATMFQAYNPLRVERDVRYKIQWHMIIAALLPIFLIYMLLGGLLTMLCWKLARYADSRIRTGRDFIADGETIRVTQFPEALISAISKCKGKGYFHGAERVEAMLFEGATKASGGTHADANERIEAIRRHAREMLMPNRSRRDTRPPGELGSRPIEPVPHSASFGRKVASSSVDGFGLAETRKEPPELQSLARSFTFFTNRKAHREWRRAVFDHFRWRTNDNRNIFGFTSDMTLWVLGASALAAVIYWPSSNDPIEFVRSISGKDYFSESDRAFADLVCSFDEDQASCLEESLMKINSGR